MFTNRKQLITSGTDSVGNVMLNRFLHTDIIEIHILYCERKQQDDSRRVFQAKMSQRSDKLILQYVCDEITAWRNQL